jgi:acyl-CoA thioester hydrolase
MSDSVFQHQHRVVYAECTLGNHVYYARYLDMLEEARGELFRQAGWPLLALQEGGSIFPVIGVEIAYKAPARYDDVLSLQLWLAELGGIRLTVGFRILHANGALLAEGQTRHICTGLDEKPKRLPKGLEEGLARFSRARHEAS